MDQILEKNCVTTLKSIYKDYKALFNTQNQLEHLLRKLVALKYRKLANINYRALQFFSASTARHPHDYSNKI